MFYYIKMWTIILTISLVLHLVKACMIQNPFGVEETGTTALTMTTTYGYDDSSSRDKCGCQLQETLTTDKPGAEQETLILSGNDSAGSPLVVNTTAEDTGVCVCHLDNVNNNNNNNGSSEPSNSSEGAPRQTDYSSWKWENLGSKQSVDHMFQVYRSGLLRPDSPNVYDMAQYEVYKHNKLVARETQCKVPRPKVIRVSDVYPSTSKLYVPACTVLHQCGDDTGCCSGTGQRCGPRYTKRVELYFYTTYIVSSHSRQRTSSSLEKLPFYNHTECECQDKMEDLMPRDSGQEYHRSGSRTSEQSCKCPSEYTVRHLANGSCTCDCFDKQRDCIKYKKGKEYFNHQDRLCIEMGTCQLPSCDFGVYLRRSGRCPRKHEKFRSWSAYH